MQKKTLMKTDRSGRTGGNQVTFHASPNMGLTRQVSANLANISCKIQQQKSMNEEKLVVYILNKRARNFI